MEQPVKYLGAVDRAIRHGFYTGKLFPKWSGTSVHRARWPAPCSAAVVERKYRDRRRTPALQNLHERIRDVRQGPDGALWLLTDSSAGRILRVAPSGK
jgi:glucose/arabinose dehydrogenase